jgi:hypothetical protein
MRIPIVDHSVGQSSQSKVKRQKFLETNHKNIWYARLLGEERGYLKCWNEPIDKILRYASSALEVCIIRTDLNKQTSITGHRIKWVFDGPWSS